MRPIRVAVVDDEPMARVRLQRLLGAHANVEVIGAFASAKAMIDAISAQPVDLLFLDIEMPEMDGFAAIAAIRPPRPAVVFVTAHAQHAVQAFAIEALDYLTKPVSQTRLDASVARAVRALSETARLGDGHPTPERWALTIGRRISLVDVDTLDCAIAQANYVELHSGARRFMVRRTLSAIETELDASRFTRIHRSHLVRNAAVASIEPLAHGRYRVTLTHGVSLVSGRGYRERLRRALGLGPTEER